LPGQGSFPALDEAKEPEAEHTQPNPGAASNGPLSGPIVPETTPPVSGADPGAESKPKTSKVLSAARRVRDYRKEGQGTTRQLDILLRHTPPSEVYFRTWPNPKDDYEVTILRVKDDSERTEVFLLGSEVADLPLLARKVRDGRLVACITSTGVVFVWALTDPDPSDRMACRIHTALGRVAQEARKGWVSVHWDNGKLFIHEPPPELVKEEPRWPTGQTLEEIFEIAISDRFISDPDHPVIRRLNTKSREV
jgi:hypothetical protein